MKTPLFILSLVVLTGCSLLQPVKTPRDSTPGNEASASVNSNGFALHIFDQQNSSYSNLSMTVDKNGKSSFKASGVTHQMDPGVISMSGASYLASQQAQYAAQQAVLAQVIQFFASLPTKSQALAVQAPASPDASLALAQVMNRMLDVITNLEAQNLFLVRSPTNKP